MSKIYFVAADNLLTSENNIDPQDVRLQISTTSTDATLLTWEQVNLFFPILTSKFPSIWWCIERNKDGSLTWILLGKE